VVGLEVGGDAGVVVGFELGTAGHVNVDLGVFDWVQLQVAERVQILDFV
jgi:hypothetical protein